MTATDERQTLTQLGTDHGWAQRTADRADVYTRGNIRIRVIWAGDSKISGASYFDDEIYEAYTRELDKLRTWLKR